MIYERLADEALDAAIGLDHNDPAALQQFHRTLTEPAKGYAIISDARYFTVLLDGWKEVHHDTLPTTANELRGSISSTLTAPSDEASKLCLALNKAFLARNRRRA